MYYELGDFARRVLLQKSIWKDGELWTAIVGGIASYFWLRYDPAMIEKIRQHLGDLLSTTSIVFGFALAALLFYIQAAAAWSKDKQVEKVADKIVDWHVWTIVCLLILIGWLIGLWALGVYLDYTSWIATIPYAFLVFLLLYSGLQILNHALTIWWSFRNRDKLNPGRS
jgi:uncharacterized membrane protein YbjE (DUF340 family)